MNLFACKYTHIVLESNDITELNDMLMNQRNSEETIRNSLDMSSRLDLDQFDDNPQVKELKRELTETKSRLSEVEGKFIKIKVKKKKRHIHKSK